MANGEWRLALRVLLLLLERSDEHAKPLAEKFPRLEQRRNLILRC
jgi:hypothetical protein